MFTIEEIIGFVIDSWDETAYRGSFDEVMDFVIALAKTKSIEVNYSEVQTRWAERYGFDSLEQKGE